MKTLDLIAAKKAEEANPVTLHEALKTAGVEIDNHESDLYCPDTPQVRAILSRYPLSESNTRKFSNQRPPNVGQIWLDIPFAFTPWWEQRQSR